MWQLAWRDHVVRWDDLTLGEVERIERLAGKPWSGISPGGSATDGMAIGHVILCRFLPDSEASVEAENIRLCDWTAAEQDLPAEYSDGVPVNPKRESDRWISQLCPPFTPSQVRDQFTLRDLQLLVASQSGKGRR